MEIEGGRRSKKRRARVAKTQGNSDRPAARATKAQISTEKPVTERYLIREIASADLDDLFALSRHLDSVNFPHNRELLSALIGRSRASFSGRTSDPFRREYMFVLEGRQSQTIAGTSMIFAQHGHPDAPHIFFDVMPDERYSITLDRHFSHTTLRIGLNYRGPTEIGALVLDPQLRALGLGKQLSYIRLLFIAMFRERFRRSVIAELMPPLLPDGRSLLWEHLGRHFTHLTYKEADQLSHTNKEFITSLFPQTPLYASLLPPDVRSLIGQVGEETKGVKRMLEAIGFEYSDRIDPFDGGPHFEAVTDEITLVKDARRSVVSKEVIPEADEESELIRRRGSDPMPSGSQPVRALVAAANEEGPCNFRGMLGAIRRDAKSVSLSGVVREMLRVKAGAAVWTVPI